MGYNVIKELVLPSTIYELDISPVELEMYMDLPYRGQLPSEISKIEILGTRENRGSNKIWTVDARHFGIAGGLLGRISCSPDLRRESVLAEAYSWIDESEASDWVSGVPQEVEPGKTPEDFIFAHVLVSGKDTGYDLS